MSKFWNKMVVAMVTSLLLTSSAAFAGGKGGGGGGLGGSGGRSLGSIGSASSFKGASSISSTPTFKATPVTPKIGNLGISNNNLNNSVKIAPKVGNLGISNNNLNNTVKSLPINTNGILNNNHGQNGIGNVVKKIGIDPKFGQGGSNVIKSMPGKFDNCHLDEKCHHHHCDPCIWNWSFGCGYKAKDNYYSACRVVRIEQPVVFVGGDIILIGEGFDVPAIAVQIEVNGAVLAGEIIAKEPNKLVVRMPDVVVPQPIMANVRLVLDNGQILDPLTVEVHPAR